MSAKKKLARQKFRDEVLKRDRSLCAICKTPDNVEIHHITDRTQIPGGGYVRENGITLCKEHLEQAELYLHSESGEMEEDAELGALVPKKLYLKIGSNYDKALKASQRLEGIH
jgi:5-methylcytosine-specific restriction endonuclease McrA